MSQDRNITVGKSWPRPATPCALAPNWEGEFRDFDDWVSFASKRLTVASDSNGADLSAICVDALGRRCHNGRDFARARDEGAFPVRYFFECRQPAIEPDGLAQLRDAIPKLDQALGEMVDDHTTSANHHPAHVLVPVAAFETVKDFVQLARRIKQQAESIGELPPVDGGPTAGLAPGYAIDAAGCPVHVGRDGGAL